MRGLKEWAGRSGVRRVLEKVEYGGLERYGWMWRRELVNEGLNYVFWMMWMRKKITGKGEVV